MRYPIKPKSVQELKRLTTPQAVASGQSEAIPYVLFDTLAYTSATTTQLSYFQTVQADKTLGNMLAGGQLVADYYMEIWGICIDPLIADTSTGAGRVGAWADMNDLMWTGRPTFTFTMNDKRVGPYPCSYFHASGGVTGFGYNQEITTAGIVAPVSEEFANWGVFDGGFWVGGAIIIPPQSGFQVTLDWPSAVTLQGGNPFLRVGFCGVMHRNVL